MKRIFLPLAIVVVLIIGGFIALKNQPAETAADVVRGLNSESIQILTTETFDHGSIVICKPVNQDMLQVNLLREKLSGYKAIYSGAQADPILMAEKSGISHMYLSGVKKTSPPVYFGVVGDSEITVVKVIDLATGTEVEAKITESDAIRVWFADLSELNGSDFQIIGLSADGSVLAEIDANIFPELVEETLNL